MNFSRGLFRLWLVASVTWILIAGWSNRVDCAFGSLSAPWCRGYAHDPYALGSALPIQAIVFGVPILALVIGTALLWVIRGFSTRA